MMQEIDDMNKGVASHEGCHVYGWLDVKRVAANFHISVHVEDYMLLAQVRPMQDLAFLLLLY